MTSRQTYSLDGLAALALATGRAPDGLTGAVFDEAAVEGARWSTVGALDRVLDELATPEPAGEVATHHPSVGSGEDRLSPP